MGTAEFQSAVSRGEPLADVTIVYRPGVDAAAATALLNSLAEDFDVYLSPHYDDPQTRIATATKNALERLFGWRITRERIPGDTCYWWKTETMPSRYPQGCEALIEKMGLSQPGADDDGQWYEWPDETVGGDCTPAMR